MMKDFGTTINNIDMVIEWWLSIDSGYMDIDELLNQERLLSGHLYHLAHVYREFNDKKNFAKNQFEGKSRRIKGFEIKKGESGIKAEIFAKEQTISEMEDMNSTEMLVDNTKVLLNAAKMVLESMKQYISYLKEEKNREFSQGNS